MDNRTVDELAQFCAEQYYRFNAEDWLRLAQQHRRAPVILARYLSGTSWYGHSEQLEQLASRVPGNGADDDGNAGPAVDIARFSGVIRYRIARMRSDDASEARAAEPG